MPSALLPFASKPCAYPRLPNFRRCNLISRVQAVADTLQMRTVDVELGDRSYPIYIGQGLLERPNLLLDHIPGKRVLIVTNETIAPLYLERLASHLLCIVINGEAFKLSSFHGLLSSRSIAFVVSIVVIKNSLLSCV